MRIRTTVSMLGVFILGAISPAAWAKTDLWVYTSIYKEFAAPLKAAFEAKNPDVQVQIFQGGSEKIQSKVEAELAAKKLECDLLLTSDPFWSQALEDRGLVAVRPGHPTTEPNYYSVMVLIAHRDFPKDRRPRSFQDLVKPEYDKLVQWGSPLESGTMFTAVAILSRKYGWDYFSKLQKNHLASNGGNSTVIEKVESGEKKIGMVLLENALAARKKGSPIEIIYPSDGAILVPSVQIALKSTAHAEAAQKFADFVLSSEGQKLIRNGYMYSVRSDVPAPDGAPTFDIISKGSVKWTPELIRQIARDSRAIKRKFSEIVLEE